MKDDDCHVDLRFKLKFKKKKVKTPYLLFFKESLGKDTKTSLFKNIILKLIFNEADMGQRT